jgi:hypothetical protein
LGDVSTGIKYVSAWKDMNECKNKQKDNMELAIKLENAKTQKERDDLKKKLDEGENEYNDLLNFPTWKYPLNPSNCKEEVK